MTRSHLNQEKKLPSDSDIEKYAQDNLNIHKKGIFRKKSSVGAMLSWSKVRERVSVHYLPISLAWVHSYCLKFKFDLWVELTRLFHSRKSEKENVLILAFLSCSSVSYFIALCFCGCFQDPIRKPMLVLPEKSLKKDACEMFKLVQIYMGDRKAKVRMTLNSVALELCSMAYSKPPLRDELYIQICRQTTEHPVKLVSHLRLIESV